MAFQAELIRKLAPSARFSDSFPISILLSGIIIAIILGWSIDPQLFTNYDPYFGNTALKLQPPGAEHWFGTDHLGRDVFSRVVYGSWSSVTSAAIAVIIGLVIGGLFGLLSGFLGGWIDVVLARFVDVLLAIPNFLLAVLIVSSFGFQTINVAIATGVSSVAVFARLMRSETLKTSQAAFVEASSLLGGSKWHIVTRHVLPNAFRSVGALAVLQFGSSILVIAGLAFLGYGDPPPAADWGVLVATGKDYPSSPWLVFAPAFIIVATVLAISRISRWMRKAD